MSRGVGIGRRRAVTSRLLVVLAVAVGCAIARGQHPDDPPPPPKGDAVRCPYWGVVARLTETTITIQSHNPATAPKEFALSADLAAGKVPMAARVLPGRSAPYKVPPPAMYRASDVRVGDWVGIEYAQVGGRVFCDHIRIQRRLGGLVPPLPEEAEALRRPPAPPAGLPPPRHTPYHQLMNAYWADRGEGGSGRAVPVAPAPREAGRAAP